ERLDVAPLPLGVDRVEGKARFTGTGEPGEHDQRVARQLEVDVLEVVLPRPTDDYALRWSHHIEFTRANGCSRGSRRTWGRGRPNQLVTAASAAPARPTATPAWGPEALTAAPASPVPAEAPTTKAVSTHPVAPVAAPGGATESSST